MVERPAVNRLGTGSSPVRFVFAPIAQWRRQAASNRPIGGSSPPGGLAS